MAQINPYLNFPGTCEKAFLLYKSTFGGEFPFISRYKDMPPAEGENAPALDDDKIMHISLPLPGGGFLFGCDVDANGLPGAGMRKDIQLSVTADSEEEARKIFAGLSASGKVTMALDKMFWGALFGMCIDEFGIAWMISYNYKQS